MIQQYGGTVGRVCTFNHVDGVLVVNVEGELHTNLTCGALVWRLSFIHSYLVLGQNRIHPSVCCHRISSVLCCNGRGTAYNLPVVVAWTSSLPLAHNTIRDRVKLECHVPVQQGHPFLAILKS